MLNELDEGRMLRLQREHELSALWPEPWIKSRTGGSDDHGLFNIGRTWTEFPQEVENLDDVLKCLSAGPGRPWTEFPQEVETLDDVLKCLRVGLCRPGGEAGSSLKLAHNFFSVGIRYYGQKLNGRRRAASMKEIMLRTLVGGRHSIRRRDWLRVGLQRKIRKIGARLKRPFRKPVEPT